jgi:predicted RNase H-like HicB family nuclease
MQYQVFVQNHSDAKFTASVLGIPGCTTEGTTREDAIAKAKQVLQERLANGELVTIDLDSPANGQDIDPWIKHIGAFANDPTFDDFLAEVAAYRQQVDTQGSRNNDSRLVAWLGLQSRRRSRL